MWSITFDNKNAYTFLITKADLWNKKLLSINGFKKFIGTKQFYQKNGQILIFKTKLIWLENFK